VAIVGMNGSGKTTLLELLLGRLALTRGRAGRGANVVVGEIEQARDGLVGAGALVEQFCEATSLSAVEARTLLAKFGLAADHFNRPAGTLSPGERTCAALAILMANGANPPVLDEPTNHLDLVAIEQLEAALDRFGGTVLLVTHDRALLRSVRIDRTLEVESGVVAEQSARGSRFP
jgi:ATPase subunit of ABC transporter with duplicated ATPase domains